MIARLDYGWRLFATGMSLAFFAFCGSVFSVLAIVVGALWPHRRSRQRCVTLVIHHFFRVLVALLQRMGVMKLELSGVERLANGGPAIVVANHPTWLDVMVLLSLTPKACCVVKRGHWGNPCFWGIVRAAEYVSNADAVGLVEAGARQLAAGYTMIVFPEGTRSPGDNRLHAFSRGFAHMALQSRSRIQPVLIDCDPPVFTKTLQWYHVPSRAFRMRIDVLEPMDPNRLASDVTSPSIAARSIAREVEGHITQSLFQHGYFKTAN
ncbi:acyltransferase family protein [Burkholderia ambifaria AMMD]|uniref:Phospholipid/glycerol acyltransferase n=1 Tax=Burkholderia ambifaria (strain ATCC BAA-244 / DSM 16087 / CCUG 44356 / LMG 19182 / AMMD) TaxID=339670 RepID=Q0B9M1_BURCM|nr:1-acyl-sn-glycerol-3-phosphate acyltransferase [Burkholderia ambifaria]ABI89152.1 phospholipid/glycerol acyltransferase [Burkholderia ambifaria AMMD]AJY25291.1 acyltransferase family protein [Burkholderia ambifaria AMMD]MBR7930889.1 1-acyl-sn-glycerol-3-phosphate acyltransferase [Burkholderia ambifaria]PEH69430.1 1-acyl-sn-glycerol-3-phosphate acyltransferase [Burkholderia ambifaria]QQC08232.1 1-acyl-sn-glycerol-3-phosphate acyltransferase [Burkholderia ambifaria]